MRTAWIAVTAFVVLLGGASVWLYFELDSVQERYEKEFAERSAALQALDARFPYEPKAELPPDRFDAYLRARAAPGEVLARRSQESSGDLYHPHATQIEMLDALAAALEREAMSLEEYLALGRRLRRVLASAANPGADATVVALAARWRSELGGTKRPEGPPLPDPATPPPPGDVALVVARAPQVEASMLGDMFILVVERIALAR